MPRRWGLIPALSAPSHPPLDPSLAVGARWGQAGRGSGGDILSWWWPGGCAGGLSPLGPGPGRSLRGALVLDGSGS